MNRYFIKLAYNGKNYHGWQIQENAHSVQAEINEKLSLIIAERINVTGCGRTDTGVHAREFFAHFDIEQPAIELKDLTYKLNRFLPADIVVFDVFEVDEQTHARFSAKSRTYKYYITKTKDPFNEGFNYYYHRPLELNRMNEAANYLLYYNDFTSFSKLHTQTKTNLCRVIQANWELAADNYIFTIKADRFLRNMVRAIVGTMVEIGKGKIKPEEMKQIIEANDRSRAGFSVPAHGLFLEKVEYESY